MDEGTAALRGSAACWSLAGDSQLLNLLQNIHQRIMLRCEETNSRLEQMSRGLRDASVNLQNVNNKFMALSNSQFVESRVFEDDTDVKAPVEVTKDPTPTQDMSNDLSKLKHSLQILESFHEPLHILPDSDSESDSDGDDTDRLVLKPKDLYTDRPLPYIIGSYAWKNKWHAGLIQEDSDTDSSTSKVEEREQYSDSDDERLNIPNAPTKRLSVEESTSSLDSEIPEPPVQQTPSDIAAELARRLGGNAQIPEREPTLPQADTVVRKLYKPQQPITGTVFSDEPPPLDQVESDSSEDDIFAELHKTASKPSTKKIESVNDLFDDFKPKNDLEEPLFGTRIETVPSHLSGEDNSILPKHEREPELITNQPKVAHNDEKIQSPTSKVPVGGISLFGSNQHTDSIGAAILKRRSRKSSDDDESNSDEPEINVKAKPAKGVKQSNIISNSNTKREIASNNEIKNTKDVKKERDIFDDLFAKSEKLNQKATKNVEFEVKKDTFGDIFDDIDDIFNTDIITVPVKDVKKNQKSLFADDDDLFAEISVHDKGQKVNVPPNKKDYNDVVPKESSTSKIENKSSNDNKKDLTIGKNKDSNTKASTGLFDSDSDDDIFTKNTIKDSKYKSVVKPINDKINSHAKINESVAKMSDASKNSDIFNDDNLFVTNSKKVLPDDEITKTNIEDDIFDDDTDLFTSNVEKPIKNVSEKDKIVEKDDELKINTSKTDSEYKDTLFSTNENEMSEHVKNQDIYYDILNSKNEIEQTEIRKNNSEVGSSVKRNDPFSDTNDSVCSINNEEMYNNVTNEEIFLPKPDDDIKSNLLNKKEIDRKPDVIVSNVHNVHTGHNLLRTTKITSDEPKNERTEDMFSNEPEVKLKTQSEENLDNLFSKTKGSQADSFNDIFNDVPPLFEKQKEPKRSKNINALFDDDSDDESLFFKKDDANLDEKPPAFTPSDEKIFDIFHDEPPAIEVDFTQKSIKDNKSDLTDTIQTGNTSTETYKNKEIYKTVIPEVTGLDSQVKEKDTKAVGKLKPMNFNINVNTLLPGASPKKPKKTEETDGKTKSNEHLNQIQDKMESNMVKSISFNDSESLILDNTVSKERAKIQVKRRPSTRKARREAVRKSVLDLENDSTDNSSSIDDAPKVVSKRVYILNDEDIFDVKKDEKKHLSIVDSDEDLFKSNEKLHITSTSAETSTKKDSTNQNIKTDNMSKAVEKPISEIKSTVLDSDDESLFRSVQTTSKISSTKPKSSKLQSNDVNLFDSVTKPESEQLQGKLRENIISNPIPSHDDTKTSAIFESEHKRSNKNIEKPKSFDNSFLWDSDDDDLFKRKSEENSITKPSKSSDDSQSNSVNLSSELDSSKKVNVNQGINTLGKVYETNEPNTSKVPHNIFDDFSQVKTREISHISKPITEEPKLNKFVKPSTTSIFGDSSDDEELFKPKSSSKSFDSKNKSEMNTKDTSDLLKTNSKKEKSKLFDDDDDDDLFGPKNSTKTDKELPQQKSSIDLTKTTEPVFIDPLSVLGNDD